MRVQLEICEGGIFITPLVAPEIRSEMINWIDSVMDQGTLYTDSPIEFEWVFGSECPTFKVDENGEVASRPGGHYGCDYDHWINLIPIKEEFSNEEFPDLKSAVETIENLRDIVRDDQIQIIELVEEVDRLRKELAIRDPWDGGGYK